MNWCRIYGALDVKIALAESKRKLNLKYILKSSKGKRNYLCLYSRALGFSFFTCKCETWHRFATATLIDIHTYVLGGFHGLACYYMVFLWVISIYMHVVVNLAPRILLFLFWFSCCQTHHLRDFIYFVWTSPRPQDNYNVFSVLKTECVTSGFETSDDCGEQPSFDPHPLLYLLYQTRSHLIYFSVWLGAAAGAWLHGRPGPELMRMTSSIPIQTATHGGRSVFFAALL